MSKKNFTAVDVHTDTSWIRRIENRFGGKRVALSILDRYVLKEILAPFLMWLTFFTILFMSIVLKDVIGDMIGKGMGLTNLLRYIWYLTAEKLTDTIPLACLIAGIMAAGRLSGDSEITAMRSSGISYPRIYVVYIGFGFATMLLVALVNMVLGPINARARENFEEQLKTYHSLTLVRPGRFLGRGGLSAISQKGQDIYAESKEDGKLKTVQIREWLTSLDEKSSHTIVVRNVHIPLGQGFLTQIVHARSGEIVNRLGPDGKSRKVMRLHRGFILERDEKKSGYQLTDFSSGYMDYAIPAPAKTIGRLNVRPNNYTFLEILDFLEKIEKGGNQINTCIFSGNCSEESGSGSSLIGETGSSGGMIVLPGLIEMRNMMLRLGFEIAREGPQVGKAGGPDSATFQKKVRRFLMFQGFLKDAVKTRIKFQVEFHRRLSVPLICLIFFFVSFPLGLIVKRSGKGMSFALAGFVFLVYYLSLNFGLSRAYSGGISPALGAWIPDIVIFAMGIYIMSSRTDDFAPLRFLMRPFRFLWAPMGRIIDPALQRILDRIPLDEVWSRFSAFTGRITGLLARIMKKAE